jgi:3-oxoacyl-[acyl-carrier protein] reductase
MELGLADKGVFVAGASRGIGRATAAAFAREGARVVVAARTAAPLIEAAAATGAAAHVAADLTQQDQIERALREAEAAVGRLDVVVANVGSGRYRSGWDVDAAIWREALEVNLLGSAALARAAVPLLARGGGTIVFVSSIAGLEALGAPLPYAAAKAALEATVKGLSRLLARDAIRVNAVVPGNVLFEGGTWDWHLQERREETERYIRDEVPLQRFATPEEIADAVLFLASDRAAFITGASLVVDGGQTRAH